VSTTKPTTKPTAPASSPAKSPAANSRYILGPRGGCYTITASGSKRYVDKSLCAKTTGQ
jgi:hypothetical protein